jgi:hypothetical protein
MGCTPPELRVLLYERPIILVQWTYSECAVFLASYRRLVTLRSCSES